MTTTTPVKPRAAKVSLTPIMSLPPTEETPSPAERLLDLAREVWDTIRGDDARHEALWLRIATEPDLVLHAARVYGVPAVLRGISSKGRIAATAKPKNDVPLMTKAERMAQVTDGFFHWRKWEDYELAGGVKLPNATRVDLLRSIQMRTKDFRTRGMHLLFERWIAERLPDDVQAVKEVWKAEELDALIRKAEAGAGEYARRFGELKAE